jgi:hypothetical protein
MRYTQERREQARSWNLVTRYFLVHVPHTYLYRRSRNRQECQVTLTSVLPCLACLSNLCGNMHDWCGCQSKQIESPGPAVHSHTFPSFPAFSLFSLQSSRYDSRFLIYSSPLSAHTPILDSYAKVSIRLFAFGEIHCLFPPVPRISRLYTSSPSRFPPHLRLR